MTKALNTQQEQDLPQAELIPNPPGGGSWAWDSEAKQWIPREEPNNQSNQTQE